MNINEALNKYVARLKVESRSTLNEASFLDRFHKTNNIQQNQQTTEQSRQQTQSEENNRSNQVVYEVNFYSRLPEDILIEYMKLGTPDNQRNNGVFLSDNGTDKVPQAFKDQHSPMKGCHAYTLYATNYRQNGAFAEPNKQVLQAAIQCINSTLKKAQSTVSQGKVNTSIVLADPVKESTRKGGQSGQITITTKPLEGIDYTGNKENITLITGAARDKIQQDDEKFTAEWRAENAKKNAHNEASDEGPSWATQSTQNAAASRGQSTTGYRANSASDRSPYYATSSTQQKQAQQGVQPTQHKDYGTNPGQWRGSKANESLNEGLSEEEKVKLWHEGKRNVNIKACSYAKLKRYYNIADKLGYTDICGSIDGEMKARGISGSDSKITPTTSTTSDSMKPTADIDSTTTCKATAIGISDEDTDFFVSDSTVDTAMIDPKKTTADTKPSSALEELKAIAKSKFPKVVTNGMTATEIDQYQDELFNELVPSSGAADTEAGEILSAWNYGLHRYFNDGDWFYGFGDTWNKSAQQCTQYLRDYVGPGLGRAAMYAKSANEFVVQGNKLILNKIFKEQLYDVPCTEDWRSYRYK